MDGSRFDELTRAFALTGSRRRVLKGVLGALAGGLLGGKARTSAGQSCAGVRRRCAADADCCSGLCDPGTGRCVCAADTQLCGADCIPVEQFQDDIDNCGGCFVHCRKAPDCQVAACIDGICGSVPDPAQVGQSCGRDAQICAEDGTCICPDDQPVLCRQGCVDTATDVANCGECGNRCRSIAHGDAVCNAGVCGIVCDSGYSACGDKCCADDRECCNGDCCGPNECCAADGCVLCQCVIGGESYDEGEINPQNACQFCDPTQNQNDWTNAGDGFFCGDGRTCCNGECCSPSECCDGVQCTDVNCPDQCEIQGQPFEDGQRNPENACQVCDPDTNRFDWTLLADQTACGTTAGRVCCNGECCSPTECCNPAGFCEECGPHCRIGGEDIDAGTPNPDNPCQVCNPDLSVSDWSTAADDTVCGGDLDEELVCCNGMCCGARQCCTDGACGACRCEIGGSEFDAGQTKLGNACLVCNPDVNRDDWTAQPNNFPCGLTNDRFCCAGDCCPAGECCNDIGECAPCGCEILGEDVIAGGVNPANTCQVCNPDQNRLDWTVLGDNEPCGTDADDRVCCGGSCCQQGDCCTDGACQPCGCEINGESIPAGTVNDANVCQVCNPGLARFEWSPASNDTVCGAGGNQHCCGGDCCAEDQCCLLDACGECLCSIDGQNVPAGTPNSEQVCEVCDPERDPFGWSVADDNTTCGDHQVCCAGNCCAVGECCNGGTCEFCGCLINSEPVPEGTINPDNPCQICDPLLDSSDWSPNEGAFCGAGHQVCCAGECCGPGQCCSLDNACEPCGCVIDGVIYAAGDLNEENHCEICDPTRDQNGWSKVEDNSPCGDNSDQVCCDGVCCRLGACCVNKHCDVELCNDPCVIDPDSCACTINGVTYPHGTANPANECQECDGHQSTTDWSNTFGGRCGLDGAQFCCSGVCCESRSCCNSDNVCEVGASFLCDSGCDIDGRFYPIAFTNPANPCEYCSPNVNSTGWSPKDNHSACSADLTLHCCDGICCDAGFCCTAPSVGGVCEPCACVIDGQGFVEGAVNPANPCQQCDSAVSATAWSPSESHACGYAFSRDCCGGICCGDTECCGFSGACEPRASDLSNCVYWQAP